MTELNLNQWTVEQGVKLLTLMQSHLDIIVKDGKILIVKRETANNR